jgi:hypothetical protein
MLNFRYLVRFEAQDGSIQYGEAENPDQLVGQAVKLYRGRNPWDADFQLTNDTATIAKVLSPLASTPLIHGVGLNYKAHADEGNVRASRDETPSTMTWDLLNDA